MFHNLYEIIFTIFLYLFNKEYQYFLPFWPNEKYKYESVELVKTKNDEYELIFPIVFIKGSQNFSKFVIGILKKIKSYLRNLKNLGLQIRLQRGEQKNIEINIEEEIKIIKNLFFKYYHNLILNDNLNFPINFQFRKYFNKTS